MAPKPPIIVDDLGDIQVFETIEQVEKYLEPIDVKEGNLTIYDSRGYRLTFTFKKQNWFDRVIFHSIERINQAQSLRDALTKYLLQLDIPRNTIINSSLSHLIALTKKNQEV